MHGCLIFHQFVDIVAVLLLLIALIRSVLERARCFDVIVRPPAPSTRFRLSRELILTVLLEHIFVDRKQLTLAPGLV